jgi:hypothetical protein
MLLPRLFRLLDSLLGWIERSERGRQVIALLLAVVWGVWAFIQSVSPPILVALAVILFAAGLVLQDYGSRWLRLKVGPPIEVHIDGMSVNFQEPDEATKRFAAEQLRRDWPIEPEATVIAPLYVLNRSRKRRVSLKIAAFRIQRPPGGVDLVMSGGGQSNPWFALTDGMRLNLGPDEDTNGEIRIRIPEGKPWVSGKHEKILVIVERVSGRIATVTIPGRYPPKRRQK